MSTLPPQHFIICVSVVNISLIFLSFVFHCSKFILILCSHYYYFYYYFYYLYFYYFYCLHFSYTSLILLFFIFPYFSVLWQSSPRLSLSSLPHIRSRKNSNRLRTLSTIRLETREKTRTRPIN